MRHFRSILYAVVLGPAVWVLVAVGLAHESPTGLVLLLLGGAAYGILASAPISPLGPAVAGVGFLVGGVWAVSSPSSYSDAWPHGTGSDLSRPGHGLAAVLAVPLLLTVLSLRRWRGSEPLMLPLVGRIGRKRESAVELPEDPTTLLRLFEKPDDRTTLLRRPSAESESTTAVRLPADGEVTTILRSPSTGEVPSDLPTQDVRSQSPRGEQPTEEVGHDSPTVVVSDERPAEDVATTLPGAANVDGELTAVIVAESATAADDEPTAGFVADEATADVTDEPATVGGEARTVDEAGAVSDEPLTEAMAAVAEPGDEARPAETGSDLAAGDQEPAEADAAEADAAAIGELRSGGEEPAEVVADGAAVDVEETAGVAVDRSGMREVTGEVGRLADEVTGPVGVKSGPADEGVPDLEPAVGGGETTAVAGVGEAVADVGDLPVVGTVAAAAAGVLAEEAEERPAVGVVAAGASAEPVVVEETTYLIVPDDGDQATAYRLPGERTVVMRPPGFVPGETTQVLGTAGEETRIILRRDVDDTQVIRLPDDGERTQVLGFSRAARTAGQSGGGQSGGPSSGDQSDGDYPDQDRPAADHPADRRPPAQRGGSIAGVESPNFADDPTGRLVFPAAQPEEPARTMTVMNMERPPEVPAPRKSPESED